MHGLDLRMEVKTCNPWAWPCMHGCSNAWTCPTCLAITSTVSLKFVHRVILDLARNSSMRRIPMLYPLHSLKQHPLSPSYNRALQAFTYICSSCLLTSSMSSKSVINCRMIEPYINVKISAFCG
jgi:hypothetical protein